jgi:hypothetical protein
VAVPLLALAGAAVGNARYLEFGRAHTQAPCLFAVVVGEPGSAKSPALRLVCRPFVNAQCVYLEQWRRELKDWQAEEEESRPPRPVLRRCLVDDFTWESLKTVLADNPRGVAVPLDELSALVCGMGQYKGGRGNDRQMFLKLWSQEAILNDRKSNPDGIPVWIQRPFAGIVGNLQPGLVERLRGEATRGGPAPDDGGFDRFLFSFPEELPAIEEQWRDVSQKSLDAWEKAVKTLLDLEMVRDEEGGLRPSYLSLSADGKVSWVRFTQIHAGELNAEDFPRHLRGPWAKLRGYCGRLALVLHWLREATGDKVGKEVDAESVEGAASNWWATSRATPGRSTPRWTPTRRRRRPCKSSAGLPVRTARSSNGTKRTTT